MQGTGEGKGGSGCLSTVLTSVLVPGGQVFWVRSSCRALVALSPTAVSREGRCEHCWSGDVATVMEVVCADRADEGG